MVSYRLGANCARTSKTDASTCSPRQVTCSTCRKGRRRSTLRTACTRKSVNAVSARCVDGKRRRSTLDSLPGSASKSSPTNARSRVATGSIRISAMCAPRARLRRCSRGFVHSIAIRTSRRDARCCGTEFDRLAMPFDLSTGCGATATSMRCVVFRGGGGRAAVARRRRACRRSTVAQTIGPVVHIDIASADRAGMLHDITGGVGATGRLDGVDSGDLRRESEYCYHSTGGRGSRSARVWRHCSIESVA